MAVLARPLLGGGNSGPGHWGLGTWFCCPQSWGPSAVSLPFPGLQMPGQEKEGLMASVDFVALVSKEKKSNSSRPWLSYVEVSFPSLGTTKRGLPDYPSREFLLIKAGSLRLCHMDSPMEMPSAVAL